MEKKAIDIKVGDNILLEYGAPENYVPFQARGIFSTDSKIIVLADSKVGTETFTFRPDEKLMVIPHV